MIAPGAPGERRDAIEHDAGPHPVRTRFRPGNDAGGIRDAPFAGQARSRFGECHKLGARVPVVPALGIGQMGREQHGLRDEVAGVETRPSGGHRARGKPEAVHAGVNLEPDAEHVRAAPGFEQVELEGLVHEGLEPVARGGFELGSIAETLQQDDARCAARLTQRHRFPDARDCEGVGARERRRRRREPVAVGIRLDDRDYPAAGGQLADPSEVVSERRRVDDGARRPVQNAPSP